LFVKPCAHLVHEYASLGKPYVYGTPTTPLSEQPALLQLNERLAHEIGLQATELMKGKGLDILTGNQPWPDYESIASIYCGHQFGVFVPQLGDGRALFIAELRSGKKYNQLQLKGAGMTPFSRMGDGRAVLRSSIREYVASEAMHALGIPTTRALSIVGTADPVFRETTETAAVVCRVSESFLRFGHIEYFSSTRQNERLADLVDWHIDRHHSDLGEVDNNPDVRFEWLKWIIQNTASLIAQWQSVGFCHGVMNTDNMSLLCQTIDYGPYGFMDSFNIDHVCNHSDHQGRYSYRNQPRIAHWNLFALTQAMIPVLKQSMDELQDALDLFPQQFEAEHNRLFARKLGIHAGAPAAQVKNLIEHTIKFLHDHEVDFTRFFRSLKSLCPSSDIISNLVKWQKDDFFAIPLGQDKAIEQTKKWLEAWLAALDTNKATEAKINTLEWRSEITKANPCIVPRNHLLQNVIDASRQGNQEPLNQLIQALSEPFIESTGYEHLYAQPPAWAKHIELSCSS
jgi:serine/tyrosine/threonine adenylyltransferase